MDMRFDTPIDGESPRAFEYFQAYLATPTPRSVEKLCQGNVRGKKLRSGHCIGIAVITIGWSEQQHLIRSKHGKPSIS